MSLSQSFSFEFSSSVLPTSTEVSSSSPTFTPRPKKGYFAFSVNSPFQEELRLSSDPSVDIVLGDVPLFSLGIVAFAVLLFFLAMKRMNRPTVYIILSAAISFTATVIDLGALLTPDFASIFALLVAREMGHAVAIGLRFLFFWVYCAELPNGEVAAVAQPRGRDTLVLDEPVHSASWTRWGTVGLVGKYILLLQTFTITIIQIIWRFGTIFGLFKFQTIHNASAYLQITAAFLLGCKLKANIFLSPRSPKSKALLSYIPAFIALFIEIGLGIGQLIVWRFPECALGRLLQAAELYILILVVLISTFSRNSPQQGSIPNSPRPDSIPSFQGVAIRNSFPTFRSALPPVASGVAVSSPAVSQQPTATSATVVRPPLTNRLSTTERLSLWISQRLSAARFQGSLSADDHDRLWDRKLAGRDGDVEQGRSPLPSASSMFEKSQRYSHDGSPSPGVIDVSKEKDPVKSFYSNFPTVPPVAAVPALPTSTKSTSNRDTEAASVMEPPTLSLKHVSTASTTFKVVREYAYPSSLSRPQSPSPSQSTFRIGQSDLRGDSPVYGLDGIIGRVAAKAGGSLPESAGNQQQSPSKAPSAKSSKYGKPKSVKTDVSGYTGKKSPEDYSPGMVSLLRHQAELDKSVARLKLLSNSHNVTSATYKSRNHPPSSNFLPLTGAPFNTSPTDLLIPGTDDRRPSTIGPDSISVSYASEFSLSNFPSPPVVTRSFMAGDSSGSSSSSASISNATTPGNPGQSDGPVAQESFLNIADTSGSSVNLAPKQELEPPTMPAAAAEHQRKMSFPSTTRGSDVSGLSVLPDGPEVAVQKDHGGKRWDVTSFIGDLTAPQHGSFDSTSSSLRLVQHVKDSSLSSQANSILSEREGQVKIVKNVRRVASVVRRPSPLDQQHPYQHAQYHQRSPLSISTISSESAPQFSSILSPSGDSDSAVTTTMTISPNEYPRTTATTTASLRFKPKGSTTTAPLAAGSAPTLPSNPRPPPIATGRVVAAPIPRSQGGILQISKPLAVVLPLGPSSTSASGKRKSSTISYFERPRAAPTLAPGSVKLGSTPPRAQT